MAFAHWKKRDPARASQAELARLLAAKFKKPFDRSKVNKMFIVTETGKPRKLTSEEMVAISEITGFRLLGEPDATPTRLSTARRAMAGRAGTGPTVPLISWVSAGKLSGSDVPANVTAQKRLPRGDLGPGQWIALRVRGDSMDRVAPEGSVIFVNVSDKTLVEERYYVFTNEEGDSTFKKYRGGRQPRLQPFSTNPDHETIPVTEDVLVVGRVRRTSLDL